MAETNPNARLEAFSDGVFAIAITLLVLEIKLPPEESITTTRDFWVALLGILPSIVTFLLSFTIILITWVNHHAAFQLIHKSSGAFIYANGFLLLAVVFLPLPTGLLGEYVLTNHAAPAVVLFDGVQAVQACGWVLVMRAAIRNGLARNESCMVQLRESLKFGYYGAAIYSICAIAAFWFPLLIAIATTIIWAGWLIVGTTIRRE